METFKRKSKVSESYKPQLTIHNFQSHSDSCRICSGKTFGRQPLKERDPNKFQESFSIKSLVLGDNSNNTDITNNFVVDDDICKYASNLDYVFVSGENMSAFILFSPTVEQYGV